MGVNRARLLGWLRAAWGTRGLVWAAALAVLAGVLCFVPLFDLLGYESSLALGLVAAFAAADIGHRHARAPAGPPAEVWSAYLRAAAAALALLVVPLLVLSSNALRVRNCNFLDGLSFFALLPVASALYAAGAGLLAGRLPGRGGRVLALALPLASIAWSLARVYFDPPVFALDPFGGYFPGPIYDEALSPPALLVVYRAANLLWLGAALSLAHAAARRTRGARALALVLGAAGLACFAARGRLGFHHDHADLRRTLARVQRTEHFVIHSDPNDGQDDRAQEAFARDLEFRYAQLAGILDVDAGVPPARPITVFRFADPRQKKRLVGAEHTLFVKPWRRELYLHVDTVPSPSLRHELAHAVAAEFGDPVFGVALAWRLPWPRLGGGLIEGIAEAADFGEPRGRATLHQSARAIVDDGRAPPLATVMGAGFTLQPGPRAYTLAASFCHFLLVRHGAARLRAVYRSGGDFEAVYGVPLAVLETQWRAFLLTQPEDEAQRQAAREQFRGVALFGRVCARDIAARTARAAELRARAPEAAVRLLRGVCADDPGEPNHRLALADALIAAGQLDEARATLQGLLDDDGLTHPVRFRAGQALARLLLHAPGGGPEAALAVIERTAPLATDEGARRTAEAQARALADPRARATLGRVLLGDGPARSPDQVLALYLLTEFARAFPDEALGDYLVGRQLVGRDAGHAAELLARACPDPGAAAPARPPLPPRFLRECLRLLGEAALRAGDLARARGATTRLQVLAETEAERLRAGDFLERLDWEAGHPGPALLPPPSTHR